MEESADATKRTPYLSARLDSVQSQQRKMELRESLQNGNVEDGFPCKIEIHIPFPTPRLAAIAIKSLQVDKELSPFVNRAFDLVPTTDTQSSEQGELSVLQVSYSATTNRMLRVSTNGFFESLALVLQCMEELDADVVMRPGKQTLQAVQGVEEVRWKEG